jgi:transposase InsO family protein
MNRAWTKDWPGVSGRPPTTESLVEANVADEALEPRDKGLPGVRIPSPWDYHVLDAGIGHVYIKPSTPRLNGKVERSHRIDQEEFYRMLEGVVIDDTQLFNDRLQEWEDFYNYNRPHGGLGGQTPYERLREKTTSPV